jgi:hypothetical protein
MLHGKSSCSHDRISVLWASPFLGIDVLSPWQSEQLRRRPASWTVQNLFCMAQKDETLVDAHTEVIMACSHVRVGCVAHVWCRIRL